MLAFEIQINDRDPLIVSADNFTTIRLSYGVAKCDVDSVSAFGADDVALYTWLDEKAQQGDKVRVRLVDVAKDKISSPQSIKRRSREELQQAFERLEQELQSKQLL